MHCAPVTAAAGRGGRGGGGAAGRLLPVLRPREQLLRVLLQKVQQQRRVVRHQAQLSLRHAHLQQDRGQQRCGRQGAPRLETAAHSAAVFLKCGIGGGVGVYC